MENNRNKVLIVDDNESNVMVCQTILDKHYITETANDGEEGLKKVKTFSPDIVLLDWDMPLKNGYEVLKGIKGNDDTKHIQVIMMTGMMTERDHMMKAYEAGVTDFIKKPFDVLELNARVNSVMRLVNFYKQQLDASNRELMSLSLQLAENTRLFDKMLGEISGMSGSLTDSEAKEKINSIQQSFRFRITESTWKQFEEHFLAVHPVFFSRLLDKHPDLTKAEIKLCALLSLNLDTKEIAAILSQEYDSVRVSRTRLRKKLSLENDEKLPNYLLKI